MKILKLIGNRDAEERVLNRRVDVARERNMKSALPGRKNCRLGVEGLKPHRDPIRVDDSLAALQHGRGRHDLSRRSQQLLALEIVDLEDFVVDALVVEDLAHLRAKWAGEKLEQACLHFKYLALVHQHLRHRGGVQDAESLIAIVKYHVG